MIKIALTTALAAAVLMPAPLLVGAIPAEAQNLKMAQVDVQLGRDRDDSYRHRRDFRRHRWCRPRRPDRWPTAQLPHGDHYGRPGRRTHDHAQGAPLRLGLNDKQETQNWPRTPGPFF